jgi:hypothetical protein
VDPGADDTTGTAALQGRAIAPDDSSVIEACSDEQWAKNPDGGKPEERKFNPGAWVCSLSPIFASLSLGVNPFGATTSVSLSLYSFSARRSRATASLRGIVSLLSSEKKRNEPVQAFNSFHFSIHFVSFLLFSPPRVSPSPAMRHDIVEHNTEMSPPDTNHTLLLSLSLSLSLPAAGEAIPKDDYDGNGSHYGKYKYWPDCSDFETDIQTTCAELDRTTCPLKEAQSSLLCEWKAKGATDWMVKTTFFGTGACISLSLSLSLPFT